MRRVLTILLFISITLLLASCTPPEPLPTYTIFADDNVLVFSGTLYDIHADNGQFVVPESANEAYALTNYNWTTRSWSNLSAYEPGSIITLNRSSDLIRIIFAWNGTLPNVTWRDTEVYLANAPGATRFSGIESQIVTNTPQIDPETLVTSSPLYNNQRTLDSELAYLGITSASSIELERGPTRWHLIKPSEYFSLALWMLALVALISVPALFAMRLPERRFLLYGPLAFGTSMTFYQLLSFTLIAIGLLTRLFGAQAQLILFIGAIIGFLLGPVFVWRRLGTKNALLSALLSIVWIPAIHAALSIVSYVIMVVISLF